MRQISNEKLNKLSTSLFLERKDYKEIFQTIVISKWTIIIETICLIFGIMAVFQANNTLKSSILLITGITLYIVEYLYRCFKVHKMITQLFPNENHPNIIRTLYKFQPDGLHVTIEKPVKPEIFTVKYNQFKYMQHTKNYTIYTTKNRDLHIIFQKENAPNIYFGFEK